MELVKTNNFKKRSVFYDGKFYYKVWHFNDISWLQNHVSLLKEYAPNLVVDYYSDKNSMTLVMNKIIGRPANTYAHTTEFIDFIYNACIKNINETGPYKHGDWVLSNMIVDKDNNVQFIDWDNINVFGHNGAIKKLHFDLESAFGENFKRYLDDTASI